MVTRYAFYKYIGLVIGQFMIKLKTMSTTVYMAEQGKKGTL